MSIAGQTSAPNGTDMAIKVAAGGGTGTGLGATVYTSVSGGKFSATLDFSANDGDAALVWYVTATDTATLVTSQSITIRQDGVGGTAFTISVSATTVPAAGGTLTVTGGSGFSSGTGILVYAQGSLSMQQVVKELVSTNSNGGFSASLVFPTNIYGATTTWSIVAYENQDQLIYSNAVSVTQPVSGGGGGQLSVSISQQYGSGPMWDIAGLVSGSVFGVDVIDDKTGLLLNSFDYAASSDTDTREFNPNAGAGTTIHIEVFQGTSSAKSNSFTLLLRAFY